MAAKRSPEDIHAACSARGQKLSPSRCSRLGEGLRHSLSSQNSSGRNRRSGRITGANLNARVGWLTQCSKSDSSCWRRRLAGVQTQGEWVGSAALLLDNAPKRGNGEVMHVYRRHNVSASVTPRGSWLTSAGSTHSRRRRQRLGTARFVTVLSSVAQGSEPLVCCPGVPRGRWPRPTQEEITGPRLVSPFEEERRPECDPQGKHWAGHHASTRRLRKLVLRPARCSRPCLPPW
jgi:hypothetical protein